MTIKYIDRHNPDLLLFDEDNNELSRVDLTRLQTLDNMHKLCILFGLREICRDVDPSCQSWASQGECTRNFAFMEGSCRLACRFCSTEAAIDNGVPCKDISPVQDCQYWSTMGQCEDNKEFMHANCRRSCGVCADSSGSADNSGSVSSSDYTDADKDEL